MPVKKVSTSSSAKRQTLGKAIPDSTRAALKRMSGNYSTSSEMTPLGDQTNSATTTPAERRRSAPAACFPTLPALLAHIHMLTQQLEKMQKQVETWQEHAASFRDQRDELRKTLLYLSEQRFIMQYNQARGRPLNEIPPLSEFTVPQRQRATPGASPAASDRSESPATPPPASPSSNGSSHPSTSMDMDIDSDAPRSSSVGPTPSTSSLPESNIRRSSTSSNPESSDRTAEINRAIQEDASIPVARRHTRLFSLDGDAATRTDATIRRLPVERLEQTQQISIQQETSIRYTPILH